MTDATVDQHRDRLLKLGLDPAVVLSHGELLLDAVRRGHRPCFPVLDTCRLDNGALLPLDVLAGGQPAPADAAAGYAAFIPAAGAASRYTQPLFALTEALETGDGDELLASVAALAAEGAAAWPLPEGVSRLFANPGAARHLAPATARQLLADLQRPKALMPCVQEGISFLEMKHYEHAGLPGLAGQVFVTPPGQQTQFAAHLTAALARGGRGAPALKTGYLAQGPALSTIRFQRDGRPFLEADGQVSVVPAGHGTLAQLFPEARQLVPEADALFIRNIDNVMGVGGEALAATRAFLACHRQVLEVVRAIRLALRQDRWTAAADLADGLLTRLGSAPRQARVPAALDAGLSPDDLRLWALQATLFHATLSPGRQDRQRLRALYERPVNLLGQVPNTGGDVGGTPCFTQTASGPQKVCIEVPHVSPADRQAFLANPEKATHFNPVFCAVEIPEAADYYASRNRDFWLLSEKVYRGTPVMYYETVLYELIGNGELANCLFVEVPRRVFNPHKTLKDALGRSAATWLTP